jgi:dolichol-phosphate mannosyltransferase
VITDRRISVIIACYRDAGSIREFWRRLNEVLPSITPNFEIIYVNDASPDASADILAELAAQDPHLVVVTHTRNFGSQSAFLSGMRVARGDAIILMDGDLQDPPHLIPDLVARWLEGNLIVYGERVARRETLFRQFAYKVFYRVFRHMANVPIPVDAGDFGLIDRKVANTLLDSFPEHLVFLRGLRAYTGFSSCGVPYVRDTRFDGRSTNSFAGNIHWAKLAIFSFSARPLRYISYLASVVLIATMCAGLYYLIAFFTSGREAPSGFMTLLCVTLFLGSVQLLCFAILAEYLGHIYIEIKQRPRYIVKDIVDNREHLEPARDSCNTMKE